jgi:hypothetical protein
MLRRLFQSKDRLERAGLHDERPRRGARLGSRVSHRATARPVGPPPHVALDGQFPSAPIASTLSGRRRAPDTSHSPPSSNGRLLAPVTVTSPPRLSRPRLRSPLDGTANVA